MKYLVAFTSWVLQRSSSRLLRHDFFLDQNNVGQAMYHHGLCVLGQVTQAYQPAWYLMLPAPYMEQGL